MSIDTPPHTPVMFPANIFYDKNVWKMLDFLTLQDMINLQGEIKSWQTIREVSKKLHWMIDFQSISRAEKVAHVSIG